MRREQEHVLDARLLLRLPEALRTPLWRAKESEGIGNLAGPLLRDRRRVVRRRDLEPGLPEPAKIRRAGVVEKGLTRREPAPHPSRSHLGIGAQAERDDEHYREAGQGAPGPGSEPTAADRGWLSEAIGLSRRSPPSATAFAVGAVVVAGDGSVLATGYSREGSRHDHAEEVALAKLDPADPRLGGATLYSSLEPCRFRASRPSPCAELIVGAGLRRVVIAWREPPVFAPGGGAALLAEAGITVVEIADLAPQARAVNAGLLGG